MGEGHDAGVVSGKLKLRVRDPLAIPIIQPGKKKDLFWGRSSYRAIVVSLATYKTSWLEMGSRVILRGEPGVSGSDDGGSQERELSVLADLARK